MGFRVSLLGEMGIPRRSLECPGVVRAPGEAIWWAKRLKHKEIYAKKEKNKEGCIDDQGRRVAWKGLRQGNSSEANPNTRLPSATWTGHKDAYSN